MQNYFLPLFLLFVFLFYVLHHIPRQLLGVLFFYLIILLLLTPKICSGRIVTESLIRTIGQLLLFFFIFLCICIFKSCYSHPGSAQRGACQDASVPSSVVARGLHQRPSVWVAWPLRGDSSNSPSVAVHHVADDWADTVC